MTFLAHNKLRTDIDYLNASEVHHLSNNEFALKSLGFQMVTRVPFEYMHFICLGVIKKIFSAIIDHKYAFKHLTI